ncbi:family 16 glycosylhydrolase [Flavobacterium sp. ARAG 55.4]|uniref:family 16 glycosylhydrolase n=1 Tax=Flavobacterium sp. ARAG 55.4 TaxID=3451357 RepID=UPI003F44778B
MTISCSTNSSVPTPEVVDPPIVVPPAESEVAFLPTITGKTWKIQPKFTNEFNFTGGKTDAAFADNWQDRFFNGWTGAPKTVYTAGQSSIANGEMIFKATIDGQKVLTGCVTSKNKVGYPLYMEARVKISESSLATAVWMLSEDSTQEIDNLEAYGDKTNTAYAQRLHLSHHIFKRDVSPILDYQPSGWAETYYLDGKGTYWADDYHTYGVLWLDPWTLKYYVDGKLVRETPTADIDPKNYTSPTGAPSDRTGLNKDMYLIISAASQPWRENQGINYLTDPSVMSATRSTSRFDYIRVYKPE